MLEVQAQLAELQAKYEAQQQNSEESETPSAETVTDQVEK